MRVTIILLILLLACLVSIINGGDHCPSFNVDIKPCTCDENNTGRNGYETVIFCEGEMTIPQLTTILRERLCGMHINKFRLDNSDIGYLPSNLFYKIIVNDIQISFTNISHFTEAGRSAFFGLERHLESLSMRNCELVDQLQWQKIGDLDRLQLLDLSSNGLTVIPPQWFRHPPKHLKFLYLRSNRIVNIRPGALSSMLKLVILDLSENLIHTIERSVLPYPGNSIAFLTLSYNKLSHLPLDFFDEMFGLRRLYLDHNRFEVLEEKVWIPIWSELDTLDVMDNPLECNCSMAWIGDLFPVQKFYGSCSIGNSSLSGRSLKSLFPWDFDCDHSKK